MGLGNLVTKNIATAQKDTDIEQIAQMMVDCDCGMIPVIEKNGRSKVVGTITDRDIVCRAIAQGNNPLEMTAGELMSKNPITINLNASREDAEDLMEQNQIRRLLVVDDNDDCIGVIAQADLARQAPSDETGKMVAKVSEPTKRAST